MPKSVLEHFQILQLLTSKSFLYFVDRHGRWVAFNKNNNPDDVKTFSVFSVNNYIITSLCILRKYISTPSPFCCGLLDDLHDWCFTNIILVTINKQTLLENNGRDRDFWFKGLSFKTLFKIEFWLSVNRGQLVLEETPGRECWSHSWFNLSLE